MEKFALFSILLVTFSCDINNDDQMSTSTDEIAPIILYGKSSDIPDDMNITSLNEAMLAPTTKDEELIIGCNFYFSGSGGPTKPPKELEHNDGNMMRYFRTLVGDRFISSDNDPDALQRVYIIGDGPCYSSENNNPKAYINVVLDSSVDSSYRSAINFAINEWNKAINENPRNYGTFVYDIPNIYYRITNTANFNDYGNVDVKMVNASQMVQFPDKPAEADTGFYRDLMNGVYQHRIGKFININKDVQPNSLQYNNKITMMVHELGHTLGFAHNNGINNSGPNISGTTNTGLSIMAQATRDWYSLGGFSDMDYLAIDYIFDVEKDYYSMNCE